MVGLRSPGPWPDRAELPPSLPLAVRTARRQAGLTQNDLSRLLAIPRHRVSAWENGHRQLTRDEAYDLEDALRLPATTLLLRMRGSTPAVRDLYARFSAESLRYATTVITERVHVAESGAVERIDVARRIRALLPVSTCFLVHVEDTDRHRVRIRRTRGCTPGNRRPLERGLVEVRLELDEPMAPDEERILRYSLEHTYPGGVTERDREHRHNGTHLHTLIAIGVVLPAAGARVTKSTSYDRAKPIAEWSRVLSGRHSQMFEWRYPGEVGCVVGWELEP